MKAARILLVDDEPALTEVLSRAFASKGHRADSADSAEAAERALDGAVYDLVLLDHVLPGATGMQALGSLRAKTKAPIHLMSGYTDDDTRRDAELLGATGFLPKPIDVAVVLALAAALPERA